MPLMQGDEGGGTDTESECIAQISPHGTDGERLYPSSLPVSTNFHSPTHYRTYSKD
jgi:hypothetical protein